MPVVLVKMGLLWPPYWAIWTGQWCPGWGICFHLLIGQFCENSRSTLQIIKEGMLVTFNTCWCHADRLPCSVRLMFKKAQGCRYWGWGRWGHAVIAAKMRGASQLSLWVVTKIDTTNGLESGALLLSPNGEEGITRCVKSSEEEQMQHLSVLVLRRLSTKHWVSFIMVVVWEFCGVPHYNNRALGWPRSEYFCCGVEQLLQYMIPCSKFWWWYQSRSCLLLKL